MHRLPHARLSQAHAFILEIHQGRGLDAQRQLIPQGVSRLVACDRAAFNEMEFDGDVLIAPSPVPAYWRRYGDVFRGHLYDHVLGNPRLSPRPLQLLTFGDLRRDPAWRKSVLYNEYYLPVGASQQLGVHLFDLGRTRYNMNCNRGGREYAPADRAVMTLVSAHIACALRNALWLEEFRRSATRSPSEPVVWHRIEIGRDTRLLSAVTPALRLLWRRYFATDIGEGRGLPDPLLRWLTDQRLRLQTEAAFLQPPQPWLARRPEGVLTVRLLQCSGHSAILSLEERLSPAEPGHARSLSLLTRRENEVLHWLAEGKRNSEIGAILGASARTVGKHLERIFAKLGVETRAAAVRTALEQRRRLDA